MATRAVAFTLRSLELCLQQTLAPGWFAEFDVPEDGSWGVLREDRGGAVFVLDEGAGKAVLGVVILAGADGVFSVLSPDGRLQALRRIHRMAILASRRQLALPHSWGSYRHGNKVTAFAYPNAFGSERVIAEVESGDQPVLFVCAATTQEHQQDLVSYRPPTAAFASVAARYADAAQSVVKRFRAIKRRPVAKGVIDLAAVGYGSVVGNRSFTSWLPHLSRRQAEFVNQPLTRSLKLRGPAGSGKTLAMQIKALRELYAVVDAGDDVRILYVTHSWSMAEQVQDGLEALDERGLARRIDAFPLVTLAETELGRLGNLSVLGDDSYSGKLAQLRELLELVDESRHGDWLAYRENCSAVFRARVEAAAGTVDASRFLWDLMLEFACVIGPNGIMPGLNAEGRYKRIDRRPWMMRLENDAEKEFVFHMYSAFVNRLLDRGQMTTDQLISDYLNFLATYRWHAERKTRGYDLLFVDEFHLFNEQERMVFHGLTRDPEAIPLLLLAMDPRQSPSETYAEFRISSDVHGSGVAERMLGPLQKIDLKTVYRYTSAIHAFLSCVDSHFPNLELGEDWGVTLAGTETVVTGGEVPTLSLHSSEEEEIGAAFGDAAALAEKGHTTALLCLDTEVFGRYLRYSETMAGSRFVVLESREDIANLRYSRRARILSQPTYVAGLQFDAVVIGGCRPRFSQYDAWQHYGLRRFLSDLYLAVSRASQVVHLHGSGMERDYPQVLRQAVSTDVLRLVKEARR